MGYTGVADWRWARRAREAVTVPVIVNGDITTADDVVRALDETGCAAVMIGRAAINHPWIFREARARLAGQHVAPPTNDERLDLYRALIETSVAARGEHGGVASAKRHVGLLGPLVPRLRPQLVRATRLVDALAVLESAA